MANTISADLLFEKIIQSAVSYAQPCLAPLEKHFHCVPLDPEKPECKKYIPMVDLIAATETGSGSVDYSAACNSTISDIELTPTLICQRFEAAVYDAADVNSLMQSAIAQFSSKVWSQIISVLTPANFGVALWAGAAESFGQAELAACQAAIRSPQRTLLLDPSYHCRLTSSAPATFPAWTAVSEADFSTSATATIGFVSTKSAVVVGLGVPIVWNRPDRGFFSRKLAIPGMEIPMTVSYSYLPSVRKTRVDIECYLAASVGRAADGRVLTSA